MAWSGGTFTRANGATEWQDDAALGIGIEAGLHDAQDNDLATGINTCLTKDGQNSPTANLPMGGFKHTGAGAGTANGQYIIYNQLTDASPLGVDFANDRLGLNIATPGFTLDVNSLDGLGISGTRFQNVTGGYNYFLRKSRGATVGTNTIVQNGDFLGVLNFSGANGTGYDVAAYIAGVVDDVPGASADMPGAISFATSANGTSTPTERLRISNAGNVQMKTAGAVFGGDFTNATVTSRNYFQTTTANSGSDLGVLPAGTGAFASITSYNNSTPTNASAMGLGVNATESYLTATRNGTGTYLPMTFYTNAAERLRITTAGKFGIGNATPSGVVEIYNTIANNIYSQFLYSTIAGDLAQPPLAIGKKDNNSTTSQIFVQFSMNSAATGSGQINANGASAVAFGTFSDARLKENITDLPSQLNNILTLRPVEFDYKDGSGHQIGFIAQEVLPIYPDLIGTREDGMYTLTDLNKNDARLIKAIQELANLVTDLQTRVTVLEGA